MKQPHVLKLPQSNSTNVAYIISKLRENGIEFPDDLEELYVPEKFGGPVLRAGKLTKTEADLFCLHCGLSQALAELTTTINVEVLQKQNSIQDNPPDRLVSEEDLFQMNMLNVAEHLVISTYEWSVRSRLNIFTRRLYISGKEFEVFIDA